ncbi:MAG TPA: zinc-ribbon domain-containing protein, partial [Myxococcales bacterium]
MRIRCNNCQALFSLQDGIFGAGGRVPVQCGRCLSVFETVVVPATPPPPPADAWERAPQQPEPDAAQPLAGSAVPAGEPAAPPGARRARWLRWTALLTGAAVLAAAGVAIYGR